MGGLLDGLQKILENEKFVERMAESSGISVEEARRQLAEADRIAAEAIANSNVIPFPLRK